MIYNNVIFQFKIPLDLGYGYCKILDFREKREFDGMLAKVFDYVPKDPIKNLDVLKDSDWLFGARRLASPPTTKGRNSWKRIGIMVSADDYIIPDFKTCNKMVNLIDDQSTIKEWQIVKNINELVDKKFPFSSVSHLEDKTISSTIGIEIRTAMEILRAKGIDVKSKFDMEDMANSNIYKAMINIPIYNKIPKKFRGKVIDNP